MNMLLKKKTLYVIISLEGFWEVFSFGSKDSSDSAVLSPEPWVGSLSEG